MNRWVLLVAIALFCLAAPSAWAHERRYAFTEEYNTLPQGGFEFEQHVRWKWVDIHRSQANTGTFKEELEYGITDHLTAAIYEVFEARNRRGDDDSVVNDEGQLELKYRLGEKGQYWLDTLLYGEYKREWRDHPAPNVLEGKLVLSKDYEKFNVVYNQIIEGRLDDDQRTEHKYAAGASYEVFPSWFVGMESTGDVWRPGSHRNRVTLGPSLAYEAERFWVATGVQFGANHAADDVQARVIVGVPF